MKYISKSKMERNFRAALIAGIVWISLLAFSIVGFAVEITGLKDTNISLTSDESGAWKADGTAISGSVTGEQGSVCDSSDKSSTSTLTITNNSGSDKNLRFKYTLTLNGGSAWVAGEAVRADGSYDEALAAGSSVDIKITSAAGIQTTSISITEIYLYNPEETVSATFKPASGGSYTVDGTTVSVATNGSAGISDGFAVSATPSSGYVLSHWLWEGTSSGNIGAWTGASTTLIPTEDCTITPVFVPSPGSTAPFKVGSDPFWSWDGAFLAAGTTQPVILNSSYTLPTTLDGNGLTQDGSYVQMVNGSLTYIVPEGAKFVVPYSSSDTGDFDGSPESKGASSDGASISSRGAYVTLTISDGITVSCKGDMNLNAQQFATSNNNPGGVLGKYGHVKLDGTNAHLNVSGKLYCYGYVTGTGTVDIVSGGSLYELLQIMDWRGGTVTLTITIGKIVFPFSQYYVQNVESNLKVNSGATTYVCAAIEAGTPKAVYPITVLYIGDADNKAFFQLDANAVMERSYNTTTDRMTYTVANGTVTVASMSLSMFSYSMDTSDYIFAMNSNMSVVVEPSGTVILSKNYKMLPNMEVTVRGNLIVQGDLYLYDYQDWQSGNYAYKSKCLPVGYVASTGKASSRTLKATSASITVDTDGKLTVTGGIYTTSGNSSADKVLKGTGTFDNSSVSSTSQTKLTEYNNNSSSTTISVSSILGNLAGVGDLKSFGTGTYYGLGEDHDNYWYKNSEVVAPTCTEAGYTKYWCDDSTKYIAVKGLSAAGHSFTKYEWDESKSAYVACCDNGCSETDERELCISLASMTMANSLNMNFAIEKISTESLPEGCYVKIRKTYADGREDVTQTIDFKDWKSTTIDGKAYYYVTFTGIAAKEMTDTIYATIYNSENTAVSAEWKDSVQAQAMRNLEKTNVTDKSKTMVVDMLNYGAAAQNKFGYATDNLATSKLTDAQKACATESVEFENTSSVDGCTYKANVSLKSNIRFLMAFKDVECSYAVIIFTNHRGTEKKITIQAEDFTANNSYSVITIEDTVVADGRQEITCKLYNEQDEVVATITDSIESYAARAASNNDEVLYKMLMKYSDSAYAYFHPGEGEE